MSCKGKKDGQYSVIDTFKYAECKGGEMTVKSCYTGLVYFQTSDNAGKCRKPTEADKGGLNRDVVYVSDKLQGR